MNAQEREFPIGEQSRVTCLTVRREGDDLRLSITLRPEVEKAETTTMTFTGVSDLRFRGESVGLCEIVRLVARDIAGRGLEGIRFEVKDDEEEFISFFCSAFEERAP